MRNYLLAVLCFVTLLAVALDIFLLRAQIVRAAGTGSRVVRAHSVGPGGPARISGEIVGFSCAAKVQAATEAIYSALNEFTIGCVNPKAKRAIEPEIAILSNMADAPLNGIVDNLSGWIEILFSARKHERYGGAEVVKRYVLEDLSRIESCVAEATRGE
jgi:hypothetical protein